MGFPSTPAEVAILNGWTKEETCSHEYQQDAYFGLWSCTKCGSVKATDPNRNMYANSCECGVDAVGEGLHSDYCPKYRKEQI